MKKDKASFTKAGRGRAAAKLAPTNPAFDRERARKAAKHLRALAAEIGGKFDWREWKKFVNEGRP